MNIKGTPCFLEVRTEYILAFLLVFSLSLTLTPVSSPVSYLPVFSVFILITVLFLREPIIKANRFYLGLFVVFSVVFGVSSLTNYSLAVSVRYISFLCFICAAIFVVPRVIPLPRLLFTVSRFCIVLVVIGLLPYMVPGKSSVFGVSLWEAHLYWYPDLDPIKSIFTTPNGLGFITMVGSVASFWEWWVYRNRAAVFLTAVNVLGLAMTNYRTGWICVSVAVAIFLVYSKFGRVFLVSCTAISLILVSVILLMMFSVVPGPEILTEMSLTRRKIRWRATIEAFKKKPFLGYGFGNTEEAVSTFRSDQYGNPHNSFLRLLAASGVPGGILYTSIVIGTLVESIRETLDTRYIILPSLLACFFLVQMFNSLSFIGVSMHSVFISLSIGYYITGY